MSRTRREQSLRAIVSVSAGILALVALCLGLNQATASEPQDEPATQAAAITASTTISPVDTVLVYDHSGSMEFDTLCYGCWEAVAGQMYPDGNLYPLHWSDTTISSADHCAGWSDADGYDCGSYQVYNSSYEQNNCNYHHRSYDDRYYIVIEAEEYSFLNMTASGWRYTPYYTFWVIQRNEYNYDTDDWVGAYGRDARGAYLSHHPYRNYQNTTGLGVACTWDDLTDGEYCQRDLPAGGPFPAPRADYDFYAPSGDEGGDHDDYYIWIRGQGGPSWDGSDRHIFWGIDGSPYGQGNYFPVGPGYDGADEDLWDWRCLGRVDDLVAGTHTLNLWAGGAGLMVDRIVIQTRDDGSCANDSSPPDSPDTYPANNGRTNWACNSCDPRFAGFPGGQAPPDGPYRPDCNLGGHPDQRENVIYDDEQSIRNALEAAKYFVGQLDIHFDQVGYVPYSTNAEIASELQCLESLGAGGCTAQVITDTVIAALDSTRAGGNTNIAGGILDGIRVLSTDAGHYGRPGAAHIIVLLADGEASHQPNDYCDDEDLWPGEEGTKDCVIYYAQEARDNDIIIYTISLGWRADIELMRAVAEITGGEWFVARPATRERLNEVFEELLTREASFAASPTSGAAPLTVTFSNTSTGTYVANLWTFGDGATSTEISPTHTYTTAGVYTVTLAVAGPGGVDTLTRTSYITVQQPPVQPDLTPSHKAVSPKCADYDERITYTVIIENATGPLTNTIHLTDAIQDGLSYAPGTLTSTSGAVTDTHAPILHWAGALSPTPAVTITYAATVVTTETQTITNVAELLVEPGLWADHTCSTKVYVNWKSIYLPLLLRDYASSAN